MRKLYCIPDCDPCKQTKEWIKEKSIDVDIVELTKIENEWHEKIDDGFIKFDESVNSFPALFVGKQGENQRVFVIGQEGIQSLLEKQYIYESKICPYLNNPCIEKKCGKFVIMTKGPIQEGNCGDYWTPILLTEMLIKGK